MTKDDIIKAIGNDGRAIIKFGASWCGPCKQVNKVLEELPEYITVVEVDVDEEDDLVAEFGIRNIPALFYYVNGQQVNKSVGSISREELLNKF